VIKIFKVIRFLISEEDNGVRYWFVDREDMEWGIKNHEFLEYGEHNGNLYGTKLDSVRAIIDEGKTWCRFYEPSFPPKIFRTKFFSYLTWDCISPAHSSTKLFNLRALKIKNCDSTALYICINV
jgi:hypothetical protein